MSVAVAPTITIFVRHSADCKYKGDEFEKRCRCRKHLRWTQNGKQHRQKAGTRSWAEAERIKREREDELAGRTVAPEQTAKTLQDAVDTFLKDKQVQGVTANVIGKYTRELARLRDFCERHTVYTVSRITRELLTDFCATWEDLYPSSTTRSKVRERLRSFLRYCYETQWLDRIPALPKMKIAEPPTMPLTAEEFTKLLDVIFVTIERSPAQKKVHALFRLMRFSGLAIRDAVTLRRDELLHDKEKDLYKILTNRQKTDSHVYVPIPRDVAEELLGLENENKSYFFWSGVGDGESSTKSFQKHYIQPVFKAAGLNGGYLKSHRLRDTFAVDLLQKGVPLEEVSKLLGHESIKTTELHYSKWVKARQDRLDTLVSATWGK